MSHLTPAEIVDFIEGTLPERRRAHAAECGRCRDDASQARLAVAAARDADVPEPSPLFWEHFPRRVRAAIADERPRARWRGLVEWRGTLAAAAALMLLVIGTTLSWRAGVALPGPTVTDTPGTAVREVAAPQPVMLQSDSEWDVVTGVADGMEWDTAGEAGLGVRPGAAEYAVLQLSDEQRQELGRLLQAEIERFKS